MQPEAYLRSVVTPLLNHPEDLVVVETKDDMGVLFTLSLHKEDMGVIIGKTGKTANAIRTLCRIIGIKNNARVSIKINEPE